MPFAVVYDACVLHPALDVARLARTRELMNIALPGAMVDE